MAETVHKGFDALDLAFRGHIPETLANILEARKRDAREKDAPVLVSVGGVQLEVTARGAKGGYSYVCNTGNTGEIWKFKRPSESGGYGIFVSVSAIRMAMHGIARVRKHLIDRLSAFGVPYDLGSERINRVDFAIDFLMPNFVLNENDFVIGHRMSRAKHGDLQEYRQDATSNRVTGLMIGRNPFRQVVIYDKRTQIMKIPGKRFWVEVWNLKRKTLGMPALDLEDRDTSQVWRVELRLYKQVLSKERYKVTCFTSLQKKLPLMLRELLRDVRMVMPTADTNKSRWPIHPFWERVRLETKEELFQQRTDLPPERILEIQRNERIQMLNSQIAGCLVSLAGLHDTSSPEFKQFITSAFADIRSMYERDPKKTEQKLKAAVARYASLRPQPQRSEGSNNET